MSSAWFAWCSACRKEIIARRRDLAIDRATGKNQAADLHLVLWSWHEVRISGFHQRSTQLLTANAEKLALRASKVMEVAVKIADRAKRMTDVMAIWTAWRCICPNIASSSFYPRIVQLPNLFFVIKDAVRLWRELALRQRATLARARASEALGAAILLLGAADFGRDMSAVFTAWRSLRSRSILEAACIHQPSLPSRCEKPKLYPSSASRVLAALLQQSKTEVSSNSASVYFQSHSWRENSVAFLCSGCRGCDSAFATVGLQTEPAAHPNAPLLRECRYEHLDGHHLAAEAQVITLLWLWTSSIRSRILKARLQRQAAKHFAETHPTTSPQHFFCPSLLDVIESAYNETLISCAFATWCATTRGEWRGNGEVWENRRCSSARIDEDLVKAMDVQNVGLANLLWESESEHRHLEDELQQLRKLRCLSDQDVDRFAREVDHRPSNGIHKPSIPQF